MIGPSIDHMTTEQLAIQQPRTVLHVISSLRIGGSEKLLCNLLVDRIQSKTFSYHLIVINDWFDTELTDILRRHGVKFHLLERPPKSRNPLYLYKFWLLTRQINPTIIHCHNKHSLYFAMLASKLSTKKIIFAQFTILGSSTISAGTISCFTNIKCRRSSRFQAPF